MLRPVQGTPAHPGDPIGAVLAGGRGRRLGGDKALVSVAGRPLIAWPVDALMAALPRVAVVVKPGGRLPSLPAGVEVWTEPPAPTHPVVGIVEALRRGGGHAVLVCAVDLPLIDAGVVRAIARAPAPPDAAAVVAVDPEGRPQPLLARYAPAALPALEHAPPDAPLTTIVRGLAPVLVEVSAEALCNVNDDEGVRAAEALLRARGYPNVNA